MEAARTRAGQVFERAEARSRSLRGCEVLIIMEDGRSA